MIRYGKSVFVLSFYLKYYRELASMALQFFKEENNLFAYKSHDTNSNILMELAKSAKDDALRELLVNRQTYR